MNLSILNKTKIKIKKGTIKDIVRVALREIGVNENTIDIGIFFISPREISLINQDHRNVIGETDVLAFNYTENDHFMMSSENIFCIGEIFISLDVVKRQARQDGFTFKKSMQNVLVHGVLHLFGYEHENDEKRAILMREMEKKIISNL